MILNTPELREKALAIRREKVAAGAHFKRDWLDSDIWDFLAKKSRHSTPGMVGSTKAPISRKVVPNPATTADFRDLGRSGSSDHRTKS